MCFYNFSFILKASQMVLSLFWVPSSSSSPPLWLLLWACAHKTLWFVGLLKLWRSKEFVSKRWGEEKTKLTTVAFSPMKPNAWSSMTIHKVWQPWVKGWRVKFQCLLLVLKNLERTITVHLIKWKGGTDIQAFDKRPAVHVSLAVIYMTGGRQGESLYCWVGLQTSNAILQPCSSL